MSSALPQNPIETIDLVGTLAAGGSAVDVGGNHPFLLDDPDSLWVVLEGEVDVFSVRLEEGGVIHDRRHLFTVEAGQMIWSLGRTAELPCWGLLAAATPSSAVYRTRYVEFCALLEQPFVHAQAAALIERWATALAGSLTESLRPKTFVPVTVGQVYTLAPSSSVSSDGGLVWVEHLEGSSHWRGNPELPAIAQPAIAPLSARTWIQAVDAVRLRGLNTHMLLDEGKAPTALDHLHRILTHHINFERQRQLEEERRRIEEQREADRRTLSGAIGALSSLLAGRGAVSFAVDTKSDPLYAACKLICEHLGVPIGPPPPPQKKRRERDPLASFDASSYLRTRRVVLRGAWWRGDHGPLLAYLVEGRQPVALLPTSPRSYELHDVRRGTRAPVDEAVASSLAPFAITFYRRFPTRALEALDLLRFGLQGCGPDLITIGLMGLAIGLLALVTPLVTGLVFDTIIPGAQRQQLITLAVGLTVGAGAATLFEVVRGFALLRVEGKLGIALQAAVWDRLVDLPARFFRDYAAGELATRAFGIDAIRRNLSAHTVTTLMASLFGLFNAALLFYYDTRLAAYGILLVLFAVLVTTASGAFHLHLQRSSAELQGRISALVLQLLNGIAKLRIAGAETRAFARWAELFRQQRLLALKTRAPLQVFGAVYPILAALVLYLAISRRRDVLSTGDFVAFIAAFTTLLVSTLQSCTSILSILGVAPTYRRLRPILETVPEIDTSKGDPGELDGEIEVVHLSFRYSDDGPAILTDVNLHIKPGEFVALVGPSGSGKSTLLRLLLGFERPSAGTIYYSGQDLGGVDVREIRRQIGVVLQNGQLLSGDIFSNIVGAANLTMEDAVEAARLAGLDKDLAAMPMGMRTVVSESSSTLSGGQRQRLLIARAIVRKPRILLFDEATSALDNRTQAIVSESIGRLEATRVVIAHRLSTIVHADRIVVLEAGRVVQVGTYEELMARPGPFVELAKRQLT